MSSKKAKSALKKQKDKQKAGPSNQPTSLPNWPLLEPLVPASDLELEIVLNDQIIVIHNFFTSTLCRKFVDFLSSLQLETTPSQPKVGEAVRVNDRIQFEDPSFARRLWTDTALQQLLNGSNSSRDSPVVQAGTSWGGELCGLNPRIRIYRYSQGQFFAQHCRSFGA